MKARGVSRTQPRLLKKVGLGVALAVIAGMGLAFWLLLPRLSGGPIPAVVGLLRIKLIEHHIVTGDYPQAKDVPDLFREDLATVGIRISHSSPGTFLLEKPPVKLLIQYKYVSKDTFPELTWW